MTEADWIKAGAIVFNAPVLFGLQTSSPEQVRAFIAKTGDLYDQNGISPIATYVIRERGKLKIGEVSCAECHNRLAIPAGVFARQGTSPFSLAKLPDLIGIKERRYVDASGLVRHRGIGDLMRYAALNQGMDMLARYGDFVPAGTTDVRQSSSVFVQFAQARYSDEQLYAMALYIYSLKPPPNPNRRTALTLRGKKIFEREGCARCVTRHCSIPTTN